MIEPARAEAAPRRDNTVAELLALANRHEQEGRLDDAETVLDGILATNPTAPGAVHQKGIVAFRRGKEAKAAALIGTLRPL